MSFDLCLWDKCNNNCLMCTNPDRPWPAWDGTFDYDFEAIKKRLIKSKKQILKSDSIYITGGEPTLHPDFLEIINFLNQNFPKQRIKLLTNGRRFFYSEFARSFLNLKINIDIEISIYGANEKTHEKITRAKGSYAQTMGGIKNLLKYKKTGQELGVRFVVTGASLKYLKNTLETIRKNFPSVDRVILIFMEYEGQTAENFQEIKLRYSETKKRLLESFSLWQKFNEFRLYHFPLCVLDKKMASFAWKTWPDKEIVFVDVCAQCLLKDYCCGIHKEYLKLFGSAEFKTTKYKNIIRSKNIYKPIEKI